MIPALLSLALAVLLYAFLRDVGVISPVRCQFGCHRPFAYRTEEERRLNVYDCSRCGRRYFGRAGG